MNKDNIKIKRALISVSDKTGIIDFAKALSDAGVEIISTGGTAKLLKENSIAATNVADITNFPEIMDGRVKTLHPKIHGGILGMRDAHERTAKEHDISFIDLVVVNLYPFAKTIAKDNVTLDSAIENIDVGGPTMIRAAAKNFSWVGVVVDPKDYSAISDSLSKGLDFDKRQMLATKAFQHTAEYDNLIYGYLANKAADAKTLHLKKFADLRYGENPHQKATAYKFPNINSGVLSATQHQGKPLSFNNMSDADSAYQCVSEFDYPACVIVKHANPCGAARGNTISDAYLTALKADPLSAFGGIVALNKTCDKDTAKEIIKIFSEVIIAPSFTDDALQILQSKPNLRVLSLERYADFDKDYKFINGGLLIQEKDNSIFNIDDLKVVTKRLPTENELQAMTFSWPVLKQMKSNAILVAKENMTVGVGVGQVSRVDAVELAIKKAKAGLENCILASDAFFPFRDSIDIIAKTNIKAIIQPGGSVKDNEVIEACNEHGIAMVFTGKRCFKH